MAWNRSLKEHMCRSWVAQMRQNVSKHRQAERARAAEAAQYRATEREEAVNRQLEIEKKHQAAIRSAHAGEAVRRLQAARGRPLVGYDSGEGAHDDRQTERSVNPLAHEGEGCLPNSIQRQAQSQMTSTNWATYRGNDNDDSDYLSNPPEPWRRRRKRKLLKEGFELMAPSRADIVEWIANAWASLTSATISVGFKRIGLLNNTRVQSLLDNATVETVDLLLWEISGLTIESSAALSASITSGDDMSTASENTEASHSDTST
ncbi:hypothetical protein DVH05_006879 [Phytophthora capsici]|nr:hypothetical protein DVH05_006879 [Phytophthora capsici]